MRQLLIKITATAILVLVLWGIPEAVLRVWPTLIGISVLDRMHPDLRSEIARRLDLPTVDEYTAITSAERLDHGPDIYLAKPNQVQFRPADVIDLAAGAIENMRTDSRGFCNPEGLEVKPSVDVVTVGGSVPNCVGVDGDHVFSAQLGGLLSVASYNLTVSGVGPYEYNEVLARFADELHPKVVVFAIGEANDLRDCERYLDHVAGKSSKRRHKMGGPFRYSYVLAFIKGSIEALAKDFSAAGRPNFRYTVISHGKAIPMNSTNGDTDELALAKKLQDGKLGVELYGPPLTQFVALAREKGFVPIVTIMPAAYTVYQDSITYENPSIAPAMRAYSDRQRQWLAENSAKIGYEFVDPTDYVKRRAASGPLIYFPSDMHPTPEGHKALAEGVADKVKEALIISAGLH
jgi:hypothetical protein